MKRTKKIFASLFMLVAFLAIGITYVNAETVKTASNLEELKDFMNDNVDVIKLNADITATDTLWWPVNGNKTLDLNGFSITSSAETMFKMPYYGDYTVKIINSSNSTSGKINHTYTADYGKTFYLDNAISGKNKTLYIDGVELNESGRATTILCFDKSSTDNLIVKNVNSKSFDFSSGFDNYEFSNTVVKPIGVASRLMLVTGNPTITVKDILANDQEIYYQAFDRVGGTMTSSGVADGDFLLKDLWTNNTSDSQDNAITVRYKSGFTVSDVTLTETYGYTATAKEISIKNRGTSDLQIKNVEVEGDKFEIEDGSQTTLSGGSTDETWKIKAKSGLDKGTYTATITVTDMSDNTYTSTVNPKELTGLGIGGVNSTITYGASYTPTLTGTTELSDGDYEFKYAKLDGESYSNIDSKPFKVGKYKVTISVTNENYTASNVSKEFSITAKTITPTIENIGDETYTGNEIKPELVVKDGSTELEKATDYTVEYANNKNVGEATVTIKAVEGSNYTFTDTDKTFNIVAKELTDSDVSLDKTSYRHTGSEIKPEPVVKDGGKTLAKDTDYELSYENNTNIGDTAIVKVTGKGNYKGEVTKNFSIIDKEPQEINFTETSVAKTYGDDNFTKTANHTKGNGTIKYTSSNTDVATVDETTGEVTIKKVGNTTIKATASATADYAQAEATYTLNIEKKEISYTATVSNKEFDNSKNATVSNVEFSGLVGSETLVKDTDYTVAYTNNTKAGTANAKISEVALSNYTFGEVNKDFTINKYEIKADDVTLEYTSVLVDGNPKTPAVTVKMGSQVIDQSNYDLTYSNNTSVGTASVKVTIKTYAENYKGEVTKTFEIVDKTLLTISGISNQEVVYTGRTVQLVGNLTVSNGINPSSLTVKWYEGTTEIDRPTNVGTYKVVYSYEDDTYIGNLEVTFEIKKATPVITLGNLSQKVGSVTAVTYTIEPAKTDGTVEVLYKAENANDTTYTTELPTEKGTYTVKVSLKNDKNLEDTEKIGTLTIAKKSSSSSGSSSSSTKTYKITVKANQKATITPSGTVEVERGESQRFKIKAKEGYEIKDVLVDGESVGAVSAYTFENVKEKHTLEVKAVKIEEKPTKQEEPTEPSQTYKDVKENVWYKKAVDYVTEKGLMNGTGNKEFSPSLTTTRGMIVTILYNLEDKPRTSKGTFSDVSDTAYYANAVAWAGENSIVTGYGDGKFDPNDVITREQLATILYKYANYKGYDTNASEETNVTNFSDAKLVSKYAVSAFNWACGEKLINGMGDNSLSPKGNATRAQVATILMHFCERYAK